MPRKSSRNLPLCGPDEVRLDDGTIRPMTEAELLNRKIDETTSEVSGSKFPPAPVLTFALCKTFTN